MKEAIEDIPSFKSMQVPFVVLDVRENHERDYSDLIENFHSKFTRIGARSAPKIGSQRGDEGKMKIILLHFNRGEVLSDF